MSRPKPIDEEKIKEAIKKTNSMLSASKLLKVEFSRFKSYALKYGIYEPNQFKGGPRKEDGIHKWKLNDILEGKHPNYPTLKLKNRLLDSKIKERKCENCFLTEWLDKSIPLVLHHRDGNEHNHKLNNLEILCPNCHTFTDTYCGKNVKKKNSPVG